MLLFYIRHGDPIYNPDSLTPLGKRQAEAVAKRLSLYGVDRIFSSSSNRAIETATPTCELVKKEAEILEFCNEIHTFESFSIEVDGERKWLFHDKEVKKLFAEESIKSLGDFWYEHPQMKLYKKGVEWMHEEVSNLLKSLGYEKIGRSGRYKILFDNPERIALFAHHGFGITFLSTLLGIPYPMFVNHFDMCHTGMTVIEFKNEDGFSIPKVLTLSSDAHLYKEELPTKYNNQLFF